MTITYKGNNISLGYDAATGTWGVQNTPTEYIDTEAFASTDPDFVYTPPTTDTPEDEEDFNPCPAGYIYDSELKQCVIDPNAESNFMQTMQSGGGNDQPAVKIAGTNRTTSDGNFIATDAEYDAMTAAELVENYKQRGMVSKDDDGNLVIDISPSAGASVMDAMLGRFTNSNEVEAKQKKHLKRLFEKKMIHSDLNPNLMNFYPSGVTSTEDYINKFPMTLLNSGDNAKIKIPTKNDASIQFVAGKTSTPFTAGFGTSTYFDREMSQGSDTRAPVFGDITTGFNESVSNYASNFANAYITNPNFNPEGTIGTSEEADKFDDIILKEKAKQEQIKTEKEEIKKQQEMEKLKIDNFQPGEDTRREQQRKEDFIRDNNTTEAEKEYVKQQAKNIVRRGTETPTGTGQLLGSSFDRDKERTPSGKSYTQSKIEQAAKTGRYSGF